MRERGIARRGIKRKCTERERERKRADRARARRDTERESERANRERESKRLNVRIENYEGKILQMMKYDLLFSHSLISSEQSCPLHPLGQEQIGLPSIGEVVH